MDYTGKQGRAKDVPQRCTSVVGCLPNKALGLILGTAKNKKQKNHHHHNR
jgi:hypothetical protein